MKFIHISDLHIGKRMQEYSLIEDQKHIFNEIYKVIDQQKPDGIILAGDIYDKSIPSAEAVQLFDDFLANLADKNLSVFIISGNHDSAERIAYGGRIMHSKGIYLSPVYDGSVHCVTLRDSFGDINVYLLPFVKPQNIRPFFPEKEITSYTDAVRTALSVLNLDKDSRNILVTHQFVTGAQLSQSEELNVGGTDNVDAEVFDDFDYVALGHIHRAQDIVKGKVRYSGTPLKYSFQEANQQKTLTVVDILSKGNVDIQEVPLTPLYEVVEIRGSYDEIMSRAFYQGKNYQESYVHITLTDEQDIVDAIGKLRTVYKRIVRLDYDNTRTRNNNVIINDNNAESKTPLELFEQLYAMQNNTQPNEEQKELLSQLIDSVWGEQ